MAGNAGNSIRLTPTSGVLPRNNQIKGNFLGVLSSGMAASASVGSSGISIDGGDGTVIGGLEAGARNIIAAGVGGVTIYSLTTNTLISGNYIGVGSDGRTLLMRGQTAGVLVRQTTGSAVFPQRVWIEGNVIANWSAGVGVSEPPFDIAPVSFSSQVTVSRNSIFYNFGAGIGLSSYAETNDFLDLDVGANFRQNYPEITSAVFGGDTFIGGILESAPLSTYRVELFANTAGHLSGFGEGETYLGFTNLVTDANGFASFEMRFSGVVPRQFYFTATATDADGNTSMFSRWFRGRALREPLFLRHPSSISALSYTNVVLQADVTGAAPLALQWTRNGVPIAGATNLSLSLSNIVWEDRGSYVLVASNAFGVVASETAEVSVIAQPTVLVQPVGALVNPGTNFTFSVVAGGMLPISYQWLWNGVAIPGATDTSLTLANVDWPMRGEYAVVLSNAFGVTQSDVVTLAVRVRPTIIQQPLSQAVVSNGFVTLSVAVSNSATAPLTYLWRSNTTVVRAETTTNYVATFDVGPVRANGAYTVQVTNVFSVAGVLSTRVNLNVLTDSDGDGLPDAYESAYGLNAEEPADAALDADGDGVSNADEYRAGTDPTDSANQLRVERIISTDGVAWLEFQARSNRAYVVEARPALGQGAWSPWVTVPARSTNGLERLSDPATGARKLYRLRTPAGD